MRDGISNRNFGNACFIDLRKAFDTLYHQLLLEKLKRYGFRVENTSTNTNVTRDNAEKLRLEIILQGSFLGRLLFLIYINDLPEEIVHSKVTLFADDISIVNCQSNSTIGKLDSSKISNWYISHKLTVNVSKCEYFNFGHESECDCVEFGDKIQQKWKVLSIWESILMVNWILNFTLKK